MLLLQRHGSLLCEVPLLSQILAVLQATFLLLGNSQLLLRLWQPRSGLLRLCLWLRGRRRISLLLSGCLLLFLIVVVWITPALNSRLQTGSAHGYDTKGHHQNDSIQT
jgi:hypothetical protein